MIAIIGPTASGKSSIGQFLVDSLNCSIVNFDSCQIYSGLSILKAIPENLKEHYLYSLVDHSNHLNVFSWGKKALEAIDIINKKKRCPILIGGTGLYLKSFIDGVDCLPNTSIYVQEFVKNLSFSDVKMLLNSKDSRVLDVYFDERRLRKSLIFILSHGFSILDAYGKYRYIFLNEPCQILALIPPKEILLQRIHERLTSSFDLMVEEVHKFNFNCYNVIGFSEIKKMLSGSLSKKECINLIEIRTRRYAKRQITFIKNSLNVSKYFTNTFDLQNFFLQTGGIF